MHLIQGLPRRQCYQAWISSLQATRHPKDVDIPCIVCLGRGMSGNDLGIVLSGFWTPSQPMRSVWHRRREFNSQVHRIELPRNCIGDESSTVGCSGNRVMLMVLSRCCLKEWGEPWLRYLLAIFRSPSELLQTLRYSNVFAPDYSIETRL